MVEICLIVNKFWGFHVLDRDFFFFFRPLWPSEFLCNRLHHVRFLLTVRTVEKMQQVCLRNTSCRRWMLATVQLGCTASRLALKPLLAATACKFAVMSCFCGSAPLAATAACFSSLQTLMTLWCLSFRLFKMNHLDTEGSKHKDAGWYSADVIPLTCKQTVVHESNHISSSISKKEISLIAAVSSCWAHFARRWWCSLFFNVQRVDVAVPAHFTPTKRGNRPSDRVHYKCQMRKRPNGPELQSDDSVGTFGSELKTPRDAVMNEPYTCSTLTPASRTLAVRFKEQRRSCPQFPTPSRSHQLTSAHWGRSSSRGN